MSRISSLFISLLADKCLLQGGQTTAWLGWGGPERRNSAEEVPAGKAPLWQSEEVLGQYVPTSYTACESSPHQRPRLGSIMGSHLAHSAGDLAYFVLIAGQPTVAAKTAWQCQRLD